MSRRSTAGGSMGGQYYLSHQHHDLKNKARRKPCHRIKCFHSRIPVSVLVVAGLSVAMLLVKGPKWTTGEDPSIIEPTFEPPLVSELSKIEPFKGKCAINLYGLPRAFKDFVLPTLIENVVKVNSIYECDYFMHYYQVESEQLDRWDSGRGGSIHSDDVLLLQNAMNKNTVVKYVKDTNEDFSKRYSSFVERLQTTRGPDGNFTYMPFDDYSYTNKTVENIVKMWHSQQSVWNLMESSRNLLWEKNYTRVAMLRNDVMYMTPLDIFRLPDLARTASLDYNNRMAVIPNFAQHPVNDRLIYGPYQAVKIWAAERFARLEDHAAMMNQKQPGQALHSEKFLAFTILPAIRQLPAISVVKQNNICLLRARPDGSIRFNDCDNSRTQHVTEHNQRAIERMIRRKCHLDLSHSLQDVVRLECPTKPDEDTKQTTEFTNVVWKQTPDNLGWNSTHIFIPRLNGSKCLVKKHILWWLWSSFSKQ